MKNFSYYCPEANPNQKKLILRELLKVLPEKKTETVTMADHDQYEVEAEDNYNLALDDCIKAIEAFFENNS